MPNPKVVVRTDPNDLAQATVDWIITSATKAIAQRGRFLLALSGGSTPEQAYTRLADPNVHRQIDWTKVFIFMGDERFVPPYDQQSNFGMAVRTLLSRVPIPYANVFPVTTQTESAEQSAQRYWQTLAAFFGTSPKSPPPSLDLILMGLGEDGHTASLFPETPALLVKDAWFTWSPPGILPPPVDRITATFPMIAAARDILFLAAGSKKSKILKEVLHNPQAASKYPAAMILADPGKITWLVDQAAAK